MYFCSIGGFIPSLNQAEMFSCEKFLRSAAFIAIGGIVALLISKLLESEEGATAPREDTGEDELNEAKQPQEHDERFC